MSLFAIIIIKLCYISCNVVNNICHNNAQKIFLTIKNKIVMNVVLVRSPPFHTNTLLHMHTFTSTHTHTHTHTYTCKNTCTDIHAQTYTHMYAHTSIHTSMYTCTHASTHTYTHMHTQTHIGINTNTQYRVL